jgi:hypothetical protein
MMLNGYYRVRRPISGSFPGGKGWLNEGELVRFRGFYALEDQWRQPGPMQMHLDFRSVYGGIHRFTASALQAGQLDPAGPPEGLAAADWMLEELCR